MMRPTRGILAFAIVLLVAGCGGPTGAPAAGAPSNRNDLITAEEIQMRGPYANIYDLIEVMRPRWLRPRGPDTLQGQQGQVQVHMDGNRLGSVAALRALAPYGITSIRWLAPLEASARYGLDHSHGAIVISTAVEH